MAGLKTGHCTSKKVAKSRLYKEKWVSVSSGGRGSGFAAFEEPVDREEQGEADEEENDAALVVKTAEKKIRIDVVGEDGQDGDSNAVFQKHHEQAGKNEESFFPEGTKGEVGDQQRKDEERDTGADAAAFLGDFDAEFGQAKEETLAENGDAAEVEEVFRDVR